VAASAPLAPRLLGFRVSSLWIVAGAAAVALLRLLAG
jgi:hypothetical protein